MNKRLELLFLKTIGILATKYKYKTYIWMHGLMKEDQIFIHLTAEEKETLHRFVLSLPFKSNCVEIGSYYGASSCFIADAAKRKLGKLYCIDTWQNQAMTEGEKIPSQISLKILINFVILLFL